MLEQLIETGDEFKSHFPEDIGPSIDCTYKNEYLQWLARLGTFCEGKYKRTYPKMTDYIISLVKGHETDVDNYYMIMEYLQTIKDLEKE